MARPKGSKNKDREGVDIPDSEENGAPEIDESPEYVNEGEVVMDGKKVPTMKDLEEKSMRESEQVETARADRKKAEIDKDARIKELEAKLVSQEAAPLEVMAKNPYFGSKQNIHLVLNSNVDPNNPLKSIRWTAAISVWPDTLDATNLDSDTKKPKQLMPDIGVDRNIADLIRGSDKEIIEYNGMKINCATFYANKKMLIKDIIKLMRKNYYDRVIKGNKQHEIEVMRIQKASS
jgi:hypothetical protein